VVKYDDVFVLHLKNLWEVMGRLCGKNMAAAIPIWLPRSPESYPEVIKKKLESVSASTIDRLLGPYKSSKPKGLSTTKASKLKQSELSAEETSFVDQRAQWSDAQGAYGHVQRTRPLTLGYALSDSPAGLAAWIVEKFREWADPRSVVPLDVLLTNVTIYWATNSIASSMRLYLESARTPLRFERGERVRVPCGIARFPYEAPFPPRTWIARAYDVVHWTNMPQGGHFAALEAPERLAADVIEFVRGLERSGVPM
jgi:pimeloyl-ACP methyl ester carboxylesterase